MFFQKKIFLIFFFLLPGIFLLPAVAHGAGNAVNFTASSGYISISTTGLPSTTDMTVCAWVYLKNYGSWNDVFNYGKSWTGLNWGGMLTLDISPSGYLNMDNQGGASPYYGYTQVPLNAWSLICNKLYGADGTATYVNNTPTYGTTSAGNHVTTESAVIGSWVDSPPSDTPNANVDELMIWNRALSDPEVTALYAAGVGSCGAAGNGLVAGYHFDSDYSDYSGNSRTGTPHGSLTFVDSTVAACSGRAATFSGSSYVNKSSFSGTPTSAFTLSAWVYLNTYSGRQMIVSIGNDVYSGSSAFLNINYGGVGKIELGSARDPIDLIGNTTLNLHQWYLVSATYDGSTAKVYVNNTEDGSQSFNGYNLDPGNLTIGSYSGSVGILDFDGQIDELTIWDKALSQSEINALYASGSGSCGTQVNSLLAGYHFDNTFYDFSGHNNTASQTGGVSFVDTTRAFCGPGSLDGSCGSSNGGSFSTAPTSNLCSVGSDNGVSGSGPWTWGCLGVDGGSEASCGASKTSSGGSGVKNLRIKSSNTGGSKGKLRITSSGGGAKAANFNGGDYVQTPLNPTTLGITGNSPRTISFWINPNNVDALQEPLRYGGGSKDSSFGFVVNGGRLYVGLYADDYDAGFSLSNNNWYYLTLTYEGTVVIPYVNGSVGISKTVNLNTTNDGNIAIGYYPSDGISYAFNGLIDEVQIWNRALNPGEITALYNSTSGTCGTSGNGLIAGYHFDNNFNDYSGNNYYGSPYGAVGFVSSTKAVCSGGGGTAKLRIK